MTTNERKQRIVDRAIALGDMCAAAIQSGGRHWQPDPYAPVRRVDIWAGLRWRTDSIEAAWWPKVAA